MPELTAKTVLLVEDESSARAYLKKSLVEKGYDVREAADGEECMDALRKQTPDLMILDLILPKKSGLEVMDEIIAEEIDVPIIILTNKSDFGTEQEAYRHGAKLYMIKSNVKLEDVVDKVDDMFKTTNSY